MLQSSIIKTEPKNHAGKNYLDSRSNSLKCTCEPRPDSEVSPTHPQKKTKHRQILVHFGLNRKKVVTLKSGKDSLTDIFSAYILGEPAYSKLLKDSYVVFQEFSSKFETWVDVDKNEKLPDGAVVKALFFPISIERDFEDPSLLKRKRKSEDKIKVRTVYEEKEFLEIDLSSSDSDLQADRATPEASVNSSSHTIYSSDESIGEIRTKQSKHTNKSKEKKGKKKNVSTPDAEKSDKNETEHSDIEVEYANAESESLSNQNGHGEQPLLPISDVESVTVFPATTPPIRTSESEIVSPANSKQEQSSEAGKSHQRMGLLGIAPDVIPLPSISSLDDALSLNKQVSKNLASSHSSGVDRRKNGQEWNFDSKDAVETLSKLCMEEIVTGPTYSFTCDTRGCMCKVMVNGKFFSGNGITTLEAKRKAAVCALEGTFPYIVCNLRNDRRRNYSRTFHPRRGNMNSRNMRRGYVWRGSRERNDPRRNSSNMGHLNGYYYPNLR